MKGAFSTPVCARKQTNGPPGIDQGFFLQAAAMAAMHCQPEQPEGCANMRPKTDDAKKRHRLLKGFNR